MDHNRSTQRKLVGLLVKLAHKGVDEFAAKYATNLSDGGMFIRTREPKPRGTELSFKVELADGQRVLQGIAVVRWTRGEGDPNGPPGMGLEFLKLDPASRALVDRMLGKSSTSPAVVQPPPAIAPQVKPAAKTPEKPGAGPLSPGEVEGRAIPSAELFSPREVEAPRAAVPATTSSTGRPPAVPAVTPSKGLPVAAPATTPSQGLPVAAPVTTPSKGLPLAAPATTPSKGLPLAAPATTPSKGLAAAAPATTPSKGLASAAPATTPSKGLASAAPATTPSKGLASAAPATTPSKGLASAAPATTPSKGLPAAALATTPSTGLPFSAPATTPSKGLVAAAPATTPSTGLPLAAPATTPSKGLGAAAPATTPSKGLPVAAPATTPSKGLPIAVPATTPSKGLAAATAATPPPTPEPLSDPDVFAALAASPHPEDEIDVDLDSLIAETPTPPPASDSGISLDLEATPSVDALISGAHPPASERVTSTASGISIELEVSAAPQPAPVLEQARPAAPPSPPAAQGPVFLKNIPPSDGTGPVIGIDLGTTNSACAVLTKGRPLILSSKDGYNTIPSVVGIAKDGRLHVGRRAQAQMVLHPTQFVFGAKRLVGRDYDSPTVKQVKERSHFEIVEGPQRRAAVKLGADVIALEEIQGLVLKECREMAEQALGTPVSRAIVTCPAYYSEPQREAVRRAGAMAGLKVERVLNEPTAAALAFGMNRELKKTVLVYDLGGGTFDATVLKLDQNVFEVLATGGDVFLGGVDFDNQLVDLLLERFATWHKRPFSGDRVALSRISEAAEKMKMQLSERSSVEVHLPMLEMDSKGKPLDLRATVTRAEMEAACTELVDRTIQAVQDVLLDAKLKASQIDDIVLVGGMSRMPLVREKLKAMFKKPPHASVNADEAVALGAALYSGTVGKVSSLVLIDVVPMTLGLARPGGAFHRLIERNTPLPATKSFGLSTEKHDQTELEVMVFQGEDSNVAGNEFVGAVTISGLPKGPAGAVKVAITLSLDAECVLQVEAREFSTRKVVRSTLATRYTSEELAQKLGISVEKRAAVNKSRGEELMKRAGGFWGKLKSLFTR